MNRRIIYLLNLTYFQCTTNSYKNQLANKKKKLKTIKNPKVLK